VFVVVIEPLLDNAGAENARKDRLLGPEFLAFGRIVAAHRPKEIHNSQSKPV
jgi:hypothetical protein